MFRLPKPVFPIALFFFQVLLLGLFAGFVDYNKTVTTAILYTQFQDVHVMIFIGFGFLMTFLKKYGFGAVSYNLLLSAITIQWGTLLNAWIKQRILKEEGHFTTDVGDIELDVGSLMTADFTAAAVLITYGALLGKVSRLQLLVIAILECIFFAINEAVIVEYLHISDVGGSIVVHLFGAYFGLTISAIIRNYGDENGKEGSVYHSDLFSMIGTLFLWVFWPSFNAGPVGGHPEQQNRAIVNTYFALAACVVTTFFVSVCVDKKYRLNMVHIQNATLAGGVAVGTSADLMIKPWGAILIGMIAAIISTLGYAYVTPFLTKRLKVHDTCGVNNLHGMPAIFAGIAAAIAAASIDKKDYGGDISNLYKKINNRSLKEQGGYQFAAVCVSFAIAVAGGAITGVIIKFLDGLDEDEIYDDEREWEIPEADNVYNLDRNQMELKATHPV